MTPRNFIEEEMEDSMPCVCDCGNTFDLDDGYSSIEKDHIVVCPECHDKEEERAGIQEEITELEEEINTAQYVLDHNPAAIKDLKGKLANL